MNILALLLGALLLSTAPAPPAGPIEGASLQEPEDPSRVLNLLDGLVERAQESSPFLALVIRCLGFLVWLFLRIKVWGPSVLVTTVVVIGFLVWQGRRKNKEIPQAQEVLEEESEM